jgi:tRNA(fMet)-specific endonuclease VapC
MALCLDTNAYSDLMRGVTEITRILETEDELIVPTVVIGELHAGFASGTRRVENEGRLDAFLRTPGTRVAPIDLETADRYGRLVHHLRRQGTPIPTNDLWIAAVALQLGVPLLTRDQHFSVIPLLAIRGWGRPA